MSKGRTLPCPYIENRRSCVASGFDNLTFKKDTDYLERLQKRGEIITYTGTQESLSLYRLKNSEGDLNSSRK